MEGSGTSVNATVRAKFGINTAEGIKMSVYLLEDGIIAAINQNNYNTDVSHSVLRDGESYTQLCP